MKIAVVGNCQCVSIREVLQHYLPVFEIFELEIWRFKGEQFFEEAKKLCGCDLILCQPILSNYFSPFTREEMVRFAADSGIPILFYHNLFFEGTLPDCRYLGKIGSRVKGAVSDYHSGIVINSYLEGRTKAESLKRLETGYGVAIHEKWDRSVAEIYAREKTVDVPFADEMIQLAKQFDSFHYFNHPKPNILLEYSKKIMKAAFEFQAPDDQWILPDLLENYGSWPVHQWVADSLGLNYSHDYFRSGFNRGLMNFPEFVSKSYEIYAATPLDNMV